MKVNYNLSFLNLFLKVAHVLKLVVSFPWRWCCCYWWSGRLHCYYWWMDVNVAVIDEVRDGEAAVVVALMMIGQIEGKYTTCG